MADITLDRETADRQMRRVAAATRAMIDARNLIVDAQTRGDLDLMNTGTKNKLRTMLNERDDIANALSEIFDTVQGVIGNGEQTGAGTVA